LASNTNNIEKRILDVNVLAIFLVKDHPGHEYVTPIIETGLRGNYIPLLLDVLPTRAFWIMTKKWGLPEKESVCAIEHFLTAYELPRYPSLTPKSIIQAFKLAKELKHDVYDCLYITLALQEKAKAIITTDTDFEKICKHTELNYINPVPKEILKRFKEQNK
jgi:predicted nucleic acid-binding protein